MSDLLTVPAGLLALVLALPVGAETLYDPMRPHSARAPVSVRTPPPSVSAGFELTAILFSPDRRVAVINGKPVSEGERVGAARVTRIAPGQVELETGGKILRLALVRPDGK